MGERLLVAAALVLATVCETLDVVAKAIHDSLLRLTTNHTQQG